MITTSERDAMVLGLRELLLGWAGLSRGKSIGVLLAKIEALFREQVEPEQYDFTVGAVARGLRLFAKRQRAERA